jgi:phage terminase small subunit
MSEFKRIPTHEEMLANPRTKVAQMIARKKFARAYVKHGGNAAQAAREIRPYTDDSARTVGMRMLKRPDVIEEIYKVVEELNIDFKYVMGARKEFVDTGLKQLNGQKKDKEPFVSPKDVHAHLQGLETMLLRLGEKGLGHQQNASVHLHFEGKSFKEVVDKHKELNGWFSGILDGEILEEPQNEEKT